MLAEDQILRAWNLYSAARKEAKKERSIVEEWERSLEGLCVDHWQMSASSLAGLERRREKLRKDEALARSVLPYLRCGAKTRRGTPCQCKPIEGKRRCKLHGGKSTGPRTPEGRARLAHLARERARLRREVLSAR